MTDEQKQQLRNYLESMTCSCTIDIKTEHTTQFITRRPPYCDRGTWLWHMDRINHPINIDSADQFPRYYFTLEAAVEEIAAWHNKRNEKPETIDLHLFGAK